MLLTVDKKRNVVDCRRCQQYLVVATLVMCWFVQSSALTPPEVSIHQNIYLQTVKFVGNLFIFYFDYIKIQTNEGKRIFTHGMEKLGKTNHPCTEIERERRRVDVVSCAERRSGLPRPGQAVSVCSLRPPARRPPGQCQYCHCVNLDHRNHQRFFLFSFFLQCICGKNILLPGSGGPLLPKKRVKSSLCQNV